MRQNTCIVNKRCARCKFHGRLGNGGQNAIMICDYIGITGHSRGCPAGAECDKFEPHNGKVVEHGPSIVIYKNPDPKGWWPK